MTAKFILVIHRFKDYIVGARQLASGFRTRCEILLANDRKREVAHHLDLSKQLRILDLANGRLRPQYLLLKAEGHTVHGIDLINRSGSRWWEKGYKLARWLYSSHIEPSPLFTKEDRLVCGDVGKLPYKDDYFDLVTSIAAFEHFLDVHSVISEIYRVLKPGGVTWNGIHLFTSPSGGHNLKLMEIPLKKIPKRVDAWDHLRKRHLPITVPLNEWRIDQYLVAFSNHFEILNHYCSMREGEHLLTPEIKAELADYTKDELTCGAYVIVARKSLK